MSTTTTTTTKSVRITKAQYFAAIRAMLCGEPTNVPMDAALAFIDKEVEMLSKKNTRDKKPTATQIANEKYKEEILNFLLTTPDGATCAAIREGIPDLAIYQTQKVAALLRPMLENGQVKKTIVKGRAIFSVI